MNWKALLKDAVAPQPKARRRARIGLMNAGYLTELLAKPQETHCPHCGKKQPPVQLRTRRRELYEARSASGAVLHLEIEP